MVGAGLSDEDMLESGRVLVIDEGGRVISINPCILNRSETLCKTNSSGGVQMTRPPSPATLGPRPDRLYCSNHSVLQRKAEAGRTLLQ